MATAPDRERRSLADQADYAAGLAFQGGDYVKAGALTYSSKIGGFMIPGCTEK